MLKKEETEEKCSKKKKVEGKTMPLDLIQLGAKGGPGSGRRSVGSPVYGREAGRQKFGYPKRNYPKDKVR